ncbi:MAG: LysR family transcriptional regulator [Pseudomonadaceae bacterium]|nr:LysR family transcriptional regulator [Pseudomonadaceae bacterium]
MATHPAFSLDWNLLKTFVAVARSGSLSAATGQLGLAHPTVARHVQQLETALDMQLFDRTSKGVILNVAGESVLAAVEDMHSSALAVRSAAEAAKAGVDSSIRITVADLMAEPMPDLLPSPGDDPSGPNLEVIVAQDLLNLLERDADIALRHARPVQKELIARRLGSLAISAFASRAYVDRVGSLTPENTHVHRFIDGPDGRLENELRARGFAVQSAQVSYRSDSLASQIGAAEAGWGIAAVPFHMARRRSELVLVNADSKPAYVDVWLVGRPEVRSNATLARTFTALGDAVSEFLATSHERSSTQLQADSAFELSTSGKAIQ